MTAGLGQDVVAAARWNNPTSPESTGDVVTAFAAQVPPHPGRAGPGRRGRPAQLRASSAPAPGGWPGTCARRASARRTSSASGCPGRPRWCRGARHPGRRRPRSCRSTRPGRRSAAGRSGRGPRAAHAHRRATSGRRGRAEVARSRRSGGGQLAYVIFTSGSTGTPKGAMIRHEAIAERLRWQVERDPRLRPGRRVAVQGAAVVRHHRQRDPAAAGLRRRTWWWPSRAASATRSTCST